MTSLIGIKIPEQDCIFIAGDRQATHYDGSVAVAKSTTQKIWVGDYGVLAFAGVGHDALADLRKRFEGKRKVGRVDWGVEKAREMIANALSGDERVFREVQETSRRMKREGESSEDIPEYVFATRDPLELWYVDDHGNVFSCKEFQKRNGTDSVDLEYIALGSGAKQINENLRAQFEKDNSYLRQFTLGGTPTELLNILYVPLANDIGSSGISMAVVTRDKVYDARNRFVEAARRGEYTEAGTLGEELEKSFPS